MRLLFFLLVLTNLIFYVWTNGYFGAPEDGHEPKRLKRQLNPEKIRIVRGEVRAAAPEKDEITCRIINGLTIADAEALKADLEAGGAVTSLSPISEPARYLIVITGLANQAAANKKIGELSRLRLVGQSTLSPKGDRLEIMLGSFESEAAALEFLQGIAKRGVRSARMERREQPSVRARLETRAPPSTLLKQLPKLLVPYVDGIIGECGT